MNNNGYLFCNYDLNHILENCKQKIKNKIQSESDEYIINVNQEEYLEYIQDLFNVECPILDEEKISIEQQEAKVEKYNRYYTEIGYVDGIIIKVTIPFVGDQNLLLARANSYSSRYPIGDVSDKQITISFAFAVYELEEININQRIQDEIDIIKKYLNYANKDLVSFNNSIKTIARSEMDYKIQKYNKIRNFVNEIRYELKKNENAPETFKAPNIVRKVEIVKPKAKTVIPEPTLELKEYDFILKICSDMAIVMERSPKAFSTMDEEAIRTHFLVQLNGHYQGQATGETFNSNGKTDILIRNNNQNVFIAECKFWKGEQQYLKTIDQLLGYVSYRDTKTALFIFVRNKDFTNVLNKIDEASKQHNNFVKIDTAFKSGTNTVFRYIFKNINDEQKHLYMTVLAFQIPTETTQH